MTLLPHDGAAAEVLRTDRYLESLLAAGDRQASDAPADPAVPLDVRRAAARLSRDLVRVHPSFRFEERLSRRLAEVAVALRVRAAGGDGTPVPLVRLGPGPEWARFDPLREEPAAARTVTVPRPLLISGAVASAALSLAGVALVARRLAGGEGDPMVRAVRAAHRLRASVAPVGRPSRAGGGGLA